MTYSPIYTVKSNAARAAKRYGLTRADLEFYAERLCAPAGWRFKLPDGKSWHEERAETVAAVAADFVASEYVEPPITGPLTKTNAEPEPELPPSDYTADVLDVVQRSDGFPIVKLGNFKPAKAKAASAKSGPRKTRDSGVCDNVVAELKARWTTTESLITMTGWLPHTLRGFISTRARALGLKAERKRIDGVTSYRLT
jgi:hypothetical protein